MKRILLTLLVIVLISLFAAPVMAAPTNGEPIEQVSTLQPVSAMPAWLWLILSPFFALCALMFITPLLGRSEDANP